MRRALYAALVLGAAVALRQTVFRQDPIPVHVYRVARGRVEETVTNSRAGTVRTRRRAALSPEIGGRIAEVLVRAGEPVRAGQVLLRLGQESLRAEVVLRERALEAARATARQACLAAEQAARDYERYAELGRAAILSQELLEQSRSSRDTTRAACEAAGAGVAEAEAALDRARVELSKTVIRAPFAGTVTEVRAEVGEWITPSPPGIPMPAVIEVIDPEAIYVEVPLDEVDVGRVREGMPARVTFDAYPDRAWAGRVTRVAPFVREVLEQNRTFDIEVELEDREFSRTLKPGTSADVEVILRARDDVLRIPSYALLEGDRVLVLREGRLLETELETGLRNWEYTEIVRGLDEGALVVASLDRAEVRAGVRARVAEELPP